MKVLMVCMGNICRSPSAQGVLEKYIENKELQLKIDVDSAGTHSYHIGSEPDSRSIAAAQLRGVDLSSQRARKVVEADFEIFDIILAMDDDNYQYLRTICPLHLQNKIHKMMSFAENTRYIDVPDPYYGGSGGFDLVLDLLENACEGFMYTQFNENKK